MSRQTVELLEAFEALPEDEKRVFTVEFLRRTLPYDSGGFEDDEAARAAADLFAVLDAEESSRSECK